MAGHCSKGIRLVLFPEMIFKEGRDLLAHPAYCFAKLEGRVVSRILEETDQLISVELADRGHVGPYCLAAVGKIGPAAVCLVSVLAADNVDEVLSAHGEDFGETAVPVKRNFAECLMECVAVVCEESEYGLGIYFLHV